MAALQIQESAAGHYKVEGDLTFASIDKKTLSATFQAIRGADLICIDLAHVHKTDSAGLALMIEWIKHSQANHTRLIFKHIPTQLMALAKLSGFDENEYFSGSDAPVATHNLDETHG